MKVLFDAIYARFTAEGKLGLTELYTVEAPDTVVWLYGTVSTNIVPGEGEFGVDWEDCLIMFTLFSNTVSHVEVCAVFTALKAAFDNHDLAVVGYDPISLIRKPANLLRVEKVWQYAITYRLLIEKG